MTARDKMRLAIELAAAIVAMLAGSALMRYAHGQTMNDRSPAACAANEAWLERCWQQGGVARIPVGTLYLRDVAETPVTVACGRVATNGSGGYWLAEHPTLRGRTSRIRQLTPGKPALRVRGAGFICTDPLFIEGTGDAAAIEVEGRASPATGRHRFANLVFYRWAAPLKTLAGYYHADTFIDDENHADNSSVSDCEAFNCDRFFWAQNQQAVNWYFDRLVINWDGKPRPVTVFDIERGGKLHVDGVEFCTPMATLFRVKDYSPNNCWLTCRNLSFDRQPGEATYLTVLDYAGDPTAASWARWILDVSGFVSQKLPAEKLYRVPDDLPRDQWCVDLRSLYE